MLYFGYFIRSLTVAVTFLGILAPFSQASVFPSVSAVKAGASAQVAPNPAQPTDFHQDIAGTGDHAVSAHQFDASQPATPDLTCDVASSSTAHIDAAGDSGSATLTTTWSATNNLAPGALNNSGSFASTTLFSYSFLVDVPSRIIIDVTTTSSLLDAPLSPAFNAMAVNHDVGFGLSAGSLNYTELSLAGVYHLEYDLAPGFFSYQLLLEHLPNSGISPWPAGVRTATTELTFSIVEVPEPATAMMLALVGAPLIALARRRRVEAS